MTENAHVMVVAQPELTGVALRVVGERVYVAYDHAALDNLTLEQWNHNAEEWYDASELVELRERAESNATASFCHAAIGGDWEPVTIEHALQMVSEGKWYECGECDYNDDERSFHCNAPCAVCDISEDE